jgi:hypothetical protein
MPIEPMWREGSSRLVARNSFGNSRSGYSTVASRAALAFPNRPDWTSRRGAQRNTEQIRAHPRHPRLIHSKPTWRSELQKQIPALGENDGEGVWRE